MNPKVCVFVDGENFRHSIIELFDEFHQEDYLPKAKWEDLFNWIVGQVDPFGKRIRTYWYVIEAIDFFPYRFPHAESETDKLKALLSKNEKYRDKINSLSGPALVKEMADMVTELKNKHSHMTKRFSGWSTIQHGIATQHKFIEFRKAGAIQYNLFTEELGIEKAVDVKLATDMLMLRDIYDIAIIVSGDQDYVPAVREVKDSGKHVVNVSFETRSGKLLPGGAWRLNQLTDWSLRISYDNFKKYMDFPSQA